MRWIAGSAGNHNEHQKDNHTGRQTMNVVDNGRKRPSLSEQINRLDKTLDGLADGLNEAVADAVKDAVGQAIRDAVQTVLKEVLGNPEVIAKLNGATVPVATFCEPAAPKPTLRDRLGEIFSRITPSPSAGGGGCRAGG